MRYHIVLIVLFVAGNGLAQRVSTSGNSSRDSQVPAQGSVDSAPILSEAVRQARLKTVDGKSLKLSDFANKVIVVNIWATWCGPCRLEMPRLSQTNKEYKSRGVVVLGLATTYNEHNDVKRVKDYLRIQKIKYKSIWDDGTLAASLVECVHGSSVIPQTFVIAKDGRIVKHFEGFNSASTPDLVREAIEQALKSNPTSTGRANNSLDASGGSASRN